jgi:hypothetical protein
MGKIIGCITALRNSTQRGGRTWLEMINTVTVISSRYIKGTRTHEKTQYNVRMDQQWDY